MRERESVVCVCLSACVCVKVCESVCDCRPGNLLRE